MPELQFLWFVAPSMMLGHEDSWRQGEAKSHFKIRLRGLWIETDGSTCRSDTMTLTPRERALFIAIVVVVIAAIALVVMIEH